MFLSNNLKYAQLSLISLVLFFAAGISAVAGEDKPARGIIDIHSRISDGASSAQLIAESTREEGISVLIFSECALRKWEYGLWPLRNLIKKTYQENSVLRLGPKKYMEKVFALKKEFPDLAIIPGVETSPFFYWEGSFFLGNLALIDYYKQFLVFGLPPKDYRDMPIIGNRKLFYFSKKALFGIWPVLLVILGVSLLRRRVLGISLIAAGFLFLLNSIPFPLSDFNAYQGNQGIKPYQDLIDYVNKRGGLIFWAHPEMLSKRIYKYKTEFYTHPHPEDLLLSRDYTGFGVTFSNMLTLAEPGNIWDQVLLEYIAGKRRKPAWIIGALHHTYQFGLKNASPENVFFVKELKEEEALNALREGRTYVRFNLKGNPASLTKFSIEKTGPGSMRVVIAGNQVPEALPLKIELIRNGKTFKSFEEDNNEWMIVVEDSFLAQEKKAYYRLRITNNSTIILSNPVFVEN